MSRNERLRDRYEAMHDQGPDAWFDSGDLERNLILKMGQPWEGKTVLEVGCGEGDLVKKLFIEGADVRGIDYSQNAIYTAMEKHPGIKGLFSYGSYREYVDPHVDIVVMQGVLEHLDDPFKELAWMFETWQPATIITSSPGFLNVRGIVWHTLAALGAVMSKTDLHYLNPWDFYNYCLPRNLKLGMESCDTGWASGHKMTQDLRKRIPLAAKDGDLWRKKMGVKLDAITPDRLNRLMVWLELCGDRIPEHRLGGATICYRIDR